MILKKQFSLLKALSVCFLFLAFIKGYGQNPPIYCAENIKLISPGHYETRQCNKQNKVLYTDSVYVSYNWSTGSTGPSTSLTGLSYLSTITVTLTVEDSAGSFFTSEVVCKVTQEAGDEVLAVWTLDHTLCPGPQEMLIEGVITDSIIEWSNGAFETPGTGGCYTNTYMLSPGLLAGTVYTIRTTQSGCVYQSYMFLTWPFPTVADPTILPTITNVGGTLYAHHPWEDLPGGTPPCLDYFQWYDAFMAEVDTGFSYTPPVSGDYYAKLRICSPTNFDSVSCFSGPSVIVCETVASLPFPYPLVSASLAVKGASVHISPNPAQTHFTIAGVSGISSVSLLSADAKIIRSFGRQDPYELDGLSTGLYWVVIQAGESRIVKPLMVE